jgi:hypothetical protein
MFSSKIPNSILDIALDTYLLYDASNRIQYVCTSSPGNATSQATWCILKLSYDGTSSRIVKKRYASGNANFDKVADDYSTYTYTDI